MKIQCKKNSDFLLIFILLIFSLLITLYCQYPLLFNNYAINDDVRQEIYFYARYRDKELFKNDFITDFYSRKAPWGLSTFYFVISKFYDPIKFTKILPFFLCALSTLYIFKFGKLLKNYIVGFVAGFLFIFVAWSRETFEFFSTGGAKSFGILFCIMFLYYFLKKKFWNVCAILFLQSLFYPPILLICLLTFIISISLHFRESMEINKTKMLFVIGLVIIIFLTLMLKYSGHSLPLINLKEMRNMEEFYPGGRTPVFFPSFFLRLSNYQSGLAVDYPLKLLFFILLLLLLFLRRGVLNLPKKLWYFIFASLTFFIIANIMMYKLYGPSRYVRHSLPIFLIIFVSLNLDKLLNGIRSKNISLTILLSFLVLTFICFIPKLQRYYIVANQPNLYNFLLTLPKDIYIAGHPTLMDNIPTFAKRKVLINEETSEPYYSSYYPIIKKRTYDFFDAYYSGSLTKIYNFCKKYGITHLIIDKSHFSKDYLYKGNFYINPFNDYIKYLIENKDRFAVMDIPDKEKIFEEGDIFVVTLKDSSLWLKN